MKKIFVFMICFCFMFNVSFALTTSSFSLDLPSDFYLVEERDNSGEYSNEKITITYRITENEPGEYYLDVEEIKENSSGTLGSLGLLLMGLDKDAKLVNVNNIKFLRSVYEDEDVKTITYLGTTAKKMTVIKFSGEELDENQVTNIMETVKLKGISGKVYEALLNLLIYGVGGFLIIGLPLLIKFLKLKKKNQEEAKQEFNNINDFQEENENLDTLESNVKNDWKI